ncbi:MAG: hypothetical protein GIKADHBN_00494 [Phycisphaerales bacterium]|nr:hypothetical protein [Phycisphaerales bacterium]
MKLRELLDRLDRWQRSRLFKIIASCVIVIAALSLIVGYVVVRNAPAAQAGQAAAAVEEDQLPPLPGNATEEEKAEYARLKALADSRRTALEATRKAVDEMLAARTDPTSFASTVATAAGMSLVVIWLGLGLTYLGLALIVALVVVPMRLLGFTDLARLAAGVVGLTAAFLAMLEAARMLLGGSGPVAAIARNMLIESVRMKASLVLIIGLILGMAALPGLLTEDSPLRYRVQTFLQFGTGGSFWIIAILTMLFACASMAYEQREKVIWQTMTKPVAAWQYVLGKWLGLVTLNAVLLIVCAASVFLFTEYLRGKTAVGEVKPFVAAEGRQVSEDRYILETQVLASRVRLAPAPPEINLELFEKNVQARIDEELRRDPTLAQIAGWEKKVRDDILKSEHEAYRSIGVGQSQMYVFTGLAEARRIGKPFNLRYQVNAGSNRPDEIYRVGFAVGGAPIVKEVGLGIVQTIPLLPTAVEEDGTVVLEVFNGDPYTGQLNPEVIFFPERGLEVSFSAGSYRWNYLRVMAVLWLKLGFLAMVAVWAGTFLSFPVACMVSFGTFIAAEGATFLSKALEYYATTDEQGNIDIVATVIHAVSTAVARSFKVYSDLNPTGRLVEGLRMPWSDVALGTVVLAAATGALFAVAVFTLRRRELAVYSGQ